MERSRDNRRTVMYFIDYISTEMNCFSLYSALILQNVASKCVEKSILNAVNDHNNTDVIRELSPNQPRWQLFL